MSNLALKARYSKSMWPHVEFYEWSLLVLLNLYSIILTQIQFLAASRREHSIFAA